MVDEAGWKRPSYYTSASKEAADAMSSAGICDISPIGKFSIQGNDLSTYLPKVLPQAANLGTNKVAIGSLSAESGVQVTVCRFAQDEVFALCPPEQSDALSQTLAAQLSGCAHVVDMTSNFAAFSICGPASATLLSMLTDLNLTDRAFPSLSCAQGKLAEVYAIIIRSDMGQLSSFQICVGRDFGAYVWEALLEAGHGLGVTPIGVIALRQLAGGH